MPFSKSFMFDVGEAAMQLSEDLPLVRLPDIFQGFYVSLVKPDIDEERIEVMNFRDFGIDKEGSFFLVLENIWGTPAQD